MSPKSAEPERARVALARCRSYGRAEVRAAVRRCFELLPESAGLFPRGSRVLLKPNLLSSRRGPGEPVNTHPEVVRAVAEMLGGEFGCELTIGDSCGSLGSGTTGRALERSGIVRICEELGARMLNVDRAPHRVVPVRDGRVLGRVALPEALEGFDTVVSLPKLKTHGLTRYTGAVKNLLGLVPGGGKKRAHVTAPDPGRFAELLVDLYGEVRPGFALLDGVVGMEGNGPNAGTPRAMAFLGASSDPVALDAVACHLIGYRPQRVPVLAGCAARGLGVADLARIETVGLDMAEVRRPDFRKPLGDRLRFLGAVLPASVFGDLIEALTDVTSTVEPERCRLCGECVRNCPAGAMRIADGGVQVAPNRCIACYCCEEVCPYNAVVMRGTPFARIVGAVGSFFGGRRPA
jgi:uncharacterized protein (DUF362 family)/NAD-dependent dihydropyrimidine dehydrogenase PreA subunit